MSELAFRTAKTQLKLYADAQAEHADVLQKHAEAMACRNCEDVIHLAVDAFQWILRADECYRAYCFSGGTANADSERDIEQLCHDWIKVSAELDLRIETHLKQGYELDRLDEYRHCSEEMHAIVKSLTGGDTQALPDSLIALRDAAIQEFHNGETAEFF